MIYKNTKKSTIKILLTSMVYNLYFNFTTPLIRDIASDSQRERDCYSKNLSILNNSSYSDWNMFWDPQNTRN